MRTSRSRLLTVVVALVLAEALAMVGLGVAFLAVVGRASQPAGAVFLAVSCLLAAAGLAAAARGLTRAAGWARGAVMTAQVFVVLAGFAALTSGAPWGLPVTAAGVVVGVGLLLPPVVAATTRPPAGGQDA